MKNIAQIENLLQNLKQLPGITTKQANNIVNHLINAGSKEVDDFIMSIKDLRKSIHFCDVCNNICLSETCDICSNKDRNKTQLCIVSSSEDVQKIEDTNSYYGLYFVLHGEINVKGSNPLNPETVKKLMKLLSSNKYKEIIIATNWTPNGEATAIFLKQIINNLLPNTAIFRIAVGLPINSALSYADSETLSQAIKNKTKY